MQCGYERVSGKHFTNIAMTIEEAYIILGLDFGANEDEINKSYKELVKLHHPDKGGDNSKMTELNTAKEIALSFARNKDIYALAIRQVKDLMVTERRQQLEKEEFKSEAQILYKKLDKKKGSYQSLKEMTVFIGIIAGIFVVLGSNILPVYQQEVGQEASKTMTKWVLLYGATFIIVYILFSTLETKIKERIETFKVNLDNKKIITKLIFEILFQNRDVYFDKNFKEFSENSFEREVREWLSIRRNNSPIRNVAEFLLQSEDRNSMRCIARQMGEEDFTQLVLLKAQEKELIEEVEIDIDRDEVKYRITSEMERLRDKLDKYTSR